MYIYYLLNKRLFFNILEVSNWKTNALRHGLVGGKRSSKNYR